VGNVGAWLLSVSDVHRTHGEAKGRATQRTLRGNGPLLTDHLHWLAAGQPSSILPTFNLRLSAGKGLNVDVFYVCFNAVPAAPPAAEVMPISTAHIVYENDTCASCMFA
jgi:hypothetical protein